MDNSYYISSEQDVTNLVYHYTSLIGQTTDLMAVAITRVSLKKLRAAQFTQSKATAEIRFARISTALATKKFWDMVSTQVTIPLRQVIQRSKCGHILKAMATQTALPQVLSEI